MSKKIVIILADIYESFPEISNKDKQEWENKKSIEYLIQTITDLNYSPILIEPKNPKESFLNTFADIVKTEPLENIILFNLIEGFKSRNREGYVPAIAEFLGIPFTGSDSYAQNISLDKYLTKLILKKENIQMKSSVLINTMEDIKSVIRFPVFVKPNGEGSSLGISELNIINSKYELEELASKMLVDFQFLLVEDLLDGDDLTVGVFGNYPNYETSSVAIVSYPSKVYTEDIKTKESMPETLNFSVNQELEKKIQSDSISICKRLGVQGYARIDWKCDAMGNPFFLEANLTPGLSAFYSALPICYSHDFGNYSELIEKILLLAYDNYNTNKFFEYGKLEKK